MSPTTLTEELTQEVKALRAQRDRLRLSLLLAYSHVNSQGNTTQWQIAFQKRTTPTLTKDVTLGALLRDALGYPPHEWDARKPDLNRAWKELELMAERLDNHGKKNVNV